MLHLILVCVFLVGCEELALPVARTGVAVKGGPFVIHLSKQGEIVIGKEQVSLKQLAGKVSVSAAAAGRHEVEAGVRASNLYVLLRIDRDAPWQHVQWILTILAEEKVYRTAFAVSTGKLNAHLPVDRAVCGVTDPPQEIKVAIHIVARKEKPEMFGPAEAMQQVTKPCEVKYRFGDRESRDLAAVTKWIQDANRAAQGEKVTIVGEIKAGHKVPFAYIVSVLDEFHSAGNKDVQFFGTQIPTKALRAKKNLPYPRKNY